MISIMIKKIMSGGQTGADRSALDVAIKYNLDHGGWVPKGRKAEDGVLPSKYAMDEMETAGYPERTRQNVTDSQGTLIISYGPLTGGSKLTLGYARAMGKPSCYIDLIATEAFEAALIAQSFVLENQIRVLNVAGPRLSNFPGIYQDVKIILETMLFLLYSDSHADDFFKDCLPTGPVHEAFPLSMEDALALLKEDLPLKTKTGIARARTQDIPGLYFSLLYYLRRRLGFDSQNSILLEQCRQLLNDDAVTIEDAVMEILKQLKKSLEDQYRLRVVK